MEKELITSLSQVENNFLSLKHDCCSGSGEGVGADAEVSGDEANGRAEGAENEMAGSETVVRDAPRRVTEGASGSVGGRGTVLEERAEGREVSEEGTRDGGGPGAAVGDEAAAWIAGNGGEGSEGRPAQGNMCADEVARLVAEAEERGYLRGRNERIEALMGEDELSGGGEGPAGAAPTGEVMILNNMRRSVWDN